MSFNSQDSKKAETKTLKRSRPSKVKRQAKTKKPKVVIVPAIVKKSTRNYSDELNDYLKQWRERDDGGWKFNKVLQNWSIDNVFDKKVIRKELLKPLLEYMMTIQGNAKERLLLRAREIADGKVENSSELLGRAVKVLNIFPETDEQESDN